MNTLFVQHSTINKQENMLVKKLFSKVFCLGLMGVLLLSSYSLLAVDYISGSTSVKETKSIPYTFDKALFLSNYGSFYGCTWSVGSGKGTVTSGQGSEAATIVFNSQGTATITATIHYGQGAQSFTYTVSVLPLVLPSTPTSTLSIDSETCGSTILRRSSSPPSGVTWHWQSSSNGTSTSNNSGATYSIPSSGTYYLRAKNDDGWSNGTVQISGTLNQTSLGGNIEINIAPTSSAEMGLSVVNHRGTKLGYEKKIGSGDWQPTHHLLDIDQTATYRVTIQNGICPAVTSAEKTVSVATSLNITIEEGTGAIRTLTGPGGYSQYRWLKDGVPLGGQGMYYSQSCEVDEPGLYQVIVLSSNQNTIGIATAADISYPLVNPNYQKQTVVVQEGVKSSSAITNSNSFTSFKYIDRQGRLLQTNNKRATPLGKDVIKFHEFDEYGKEIKSYLPYVATTTNGSYDLDASTNQLNYYASGSLIDHDTKPWSEVEIEKSPAKRLTKSGGLGEGYQLEDNHATKYEYSFNTLSNKVFKWGIESDGSLKLDEDIYYDSNDLSKQTVKSSEYTSGNDHKTIAYTNHLGQKILTRYYNGSDQFDTYYVYDDYGQLVYIVPPEASKMARGSGVFRVTDENVFESTQTFPSTSSTSDAYYYRQGATVTLPAGRTFTTGFSIKPIPEGPTANSSASETDFGQLLFINTYDNYRRLVSKKVPGVDPVYYVYDKAGRLRLSQDGEQRKNDQWTFTKYDELDRPVLTGLYTDNSRSHSDLQTLVLGQDAQVHESRGTARHGYDNASWPTSVGENDYLVVSYYDDYDFMDSNWSAFAYDNTNDINNDDYRIYPMGLETGGKIKILGTTNQWLKSTKFYDEDLQLIQGISDHHMNGLENVYTQYDWLGQITQTRFTHEMEGGKIVTIDERFEYDKSGRLLEQYHSIDEEPEILVAEYHYNELGELIEKNLHKQEDDTFVQSVDFRSNIRGQLTHINQASRTELDNDTDQNYDRFGMDLYYDSSPTGANFFSPDKSGNLAGVTWNTPNSGGVQWRSYAYKYDKANRLVEANYDEWIGMGYYANTNAFDLTDVSYDLNGNIKTLKRKHDNTLVDDLDYKYDGNQLLSLNDKTSEDEGFKDGAELATEYTYDANGNMISDANKLITSISYNMLNKPETITFTNGDHIDYTYDAAGTRLSMTVTTGSDTYVTDYSSGLIFEQDVLTSLSMTQGRIAVEKVAEDYNYDYQYYLTDHLGNTRAMVAPTERVYLATMESENATPEEAQFLNVDATRQLDAANAKYGDESARLNPKDGRIIGPAKAIKVYAGDEVELSVHGKYLSTTGASQTSTSMLIFDAVSSTYGINSGELFDALQSELGGSSLLSQAAGEIPTAYLNYIFYDANYENPQVGYEQLSGAPDTYEKLSHSFVAPEEGYLLTYVSHESTLDVDVFFDNFKIIHTSSSSVLQSDDYYPFGLPIAGNKYEDLDNTENRFLYQGKEWQTQLALNLYDFHARQYDPATGRFAGVDPQAGKFAGMSPYMGMGNNPMLNIDPDGEAFFAIPAIIAAVKAGAIMGASISAISYTANAAMTGNFDPSDFLESTVKGAIRGGVSAGIGQGFSQIGVALMGSSTGLGAGLTGLGIEAVSTTASSIAGNLATGEDWNSHLNIGVGPLNLPFRDGKFSTNLFDHVDNLYVLNHHARAFGDVVKGNSTSTFDKTSMSFAFQAKDGKEGYISKILGNDPGRAMGGSILINSPDKLSIQSEKYRQYLNTSGDGYLGNPKKSAEALINGENRSYAVSLHEGTHVLQQRFTGGQYTKNSYGNMLNKYYQRNDMLFIRFNSSIEERAIIRAHRILFK